MQYDHVISLTEKLNDKSFHLACGYYDTTSFLFEKANFAVVIHCKGNFTFYTVDGTQLETIKGKRVASGKECYEDILITTTDDGVHFKLPSYRWIDHYPNCDGESDRWDCVIDGVNDEIFYKAIKK